jgi:hypothetical protein
MALFRFVPALILVAGVAITYQLVRWQDQQK